MAHRLSPQFRKDHVLMSCRVYITSDAFKGKMQPARHRMVYSLMKDEMAAEGGIHALQLRTRTIEEEEKAKAKDDS
jgi:BolA protein